MEEPGVPLSHFFLIFFQEPCGEYRTPSSPLQCSSQILDAIARLSQEAGHAHGSLNLYIGTMVVYNAMEKRKKSP